MPATAVPIRIETDRGVIDAALALAAAPITVCNALRYIVGGHYDGGRFFRTVRSDRNDGTAPPIDVIQLEARAGEEHDAFGPIPLERTSVTGLRHRAGALSMARWGPDTATSSFSIVTRPSPSMDFAGPRNRDGQGFAVFGHVTRGMDVVRAIHRAEADGERLRPPVRIARITVRRASRAVIRAVRDRCALAIDGQRRGAG
ncbi:peptidylprolyl isomerase [Sphingomonas flavalba]|uniref:peptidylprolyl isomerase n=1 Tax=Sphingomonas flavalba TaxID=2559804 RepID=UPI0039DF7EBA